MRRPAGENTPAGMRKGGDWRENAPVDGRTRTSLRNSFPNVVTVPDSRYETGHPRAVLLVHRAEAASQLPLLERDHDRCWVEVKSVTLMDDRGRYAFPDAITTRGRRHLHDLAKAVRQGDRAVILFLIQRADGSMFTTADDIDPDYADELRRSVDAGVEPLAYRADVSPQGITVVEPLPIEL